MRTGRPDISRCPTGHSMYWMSKAAAFARGFHIFLRLNPLCGVHDSLFMPLRICPVHACVCVRERERVVHSLGATTQRELVLR